MAMKLQEFTIEDVQKFPALGVLKTLAEGAIKQTSQGFPPKRMNGYPVESCWSLQKDWLVILELENSAKQTTRFHYYLIHENDVPKIGMMLVTDTVEEKFTTEEFLKLLPIG